MPITLKKKFKCYWKNVCIDSLHTDFVYCVVLFLEFWWLYLTAKEDLKIVNVSVDGCFSFYVSPVISCWLRVVRHKKVPGIHAKGGATETVFPTRISELTLQGSSKYTPSCSIAGWNTYSIWISIIFNILKRLFMTVVHLFTILVVFKYGLVKCYWHSCSCGRYKTPDASLL